MNLFVTILLAILIFGVIIIIHELGHFLTAKAVGIAVPMLGLKGTGDIPKKVAALLP